MIVSKAVVFGGLRGRRLTEQEVANHQREGIFQKM
jgi:hypothetical protein